MLSTACMVAALVAPQDITVSSMANDVAYFGSDAGIAGYSADTTACNLSGAPAPWTPNDQASPVSTQNLYRILDGRFEQLGYSFLSLEVCAVNEASCGTCQPTSCQTLGAGCATTNPASLNDGGFGFTKVGVDPTTGVRPANLGGPTGPSFNKGRLQASESELSAAGAELIYEVQFVYATDSQAGLGQDNLAWRPVDTIGSGFNLAADGPVSPGQPAIYAWAASDSSVTVTPLLNLDEGGPGVHGAYYLGYRVQHLGGELYRYDYAIQNTTSRVAARGFEIPLDCGPIDITSPTFRDVDAHSGDPWDPTDWSYQQSADQVSWTGADFNNAPMGNALRWGTTYSFGFVANAAPRVANVRLELFEGGGLLETPALVPGPSFPVVCAANPNSTGLSAELLGLGSGDVAAADLQLICYALPANTLGYFLMSQGQQFLPSFAGSQGNLCVGGMGMPILRFAGDVLDSGVFASVVFQPDFAALPQGIMFQPGDTWFFQYWYRDMNPGSTSNTSSALQVSFCP